MINLFLWTFSGYIFGLSLSCFTNLIKKELYNKELSNSSIYSIIFITTSLSFLRGLSDYL
jgi:hypothetical protein